MKAWSLDTDMSDILISHWCPRPYHEWFGGCTSFIGSSNGDFIKYNPLETVFSFVMLSKIMYGVYGLSISTRSRKRPFISILLGRGSWQTSQSSLSFHDIWILLPFVYQCIARLFLVASTLDPLPLTLDMHELAGSLTLTWWYEGIGFGLLIVETNFAGFGDCTR